MFESVRHKDTTPIYFVVPLIWTASLQAVTEPASEQAVMLHGRTLGRYLKLVFMGTHDRCGQVRIARLSFSSLL